MRCHKEYAIQVFGNRVGAIPTGTFQEARITSKQMHDDVPLVLRHMMAFPQQQINCRGFPEYKVVFNSWRFEPYPHLPHFARIFIDNQTTINSRTLLRSKMRPTQNKGEFNGFRQHNIYTYLYCSHQKMGVRQRVYFPKSLLSPQKKVRWDHHPMFEQLYFVMRNMNEIWIKAA